MGDILVGTAVTDVTGVAHFTVRRSAHTNFWVHQDTGDGYAHTASELYQLHIRGTVALTVPTYARHGRAFTVTATVNPSGSGQLVTLQRRVGTGWVTITRARTSGNRATMSVLCRTVATWDLPAVVANSAHWYGGSSRTMRVRIL